ncbi:MAG: DNA translocase FtsK, partial [Pseudomonadota bacterium]
MRSSRLTASNTARTRTPDAATNAGGLRATLRSLFGLALFAGLATIAASLATWSVNDPSITHATDGEAQNLLGYFGASLSDLLMQFFGLAVIAALIPAGLLAWRLTFASPLPHMRPRFLAWMGGILAASAALGALPRFASWPLPNGLGGILGDGVLQLPAWLMGGFPTGVWALVFFLMFGALAVAALMYAAIIIRRPDASHAPNDEFAPNLTEVGEVEDEYHRRPGLLLGLAGHIILTSRYHLHRAWLRFNTWRSARAQALAERRARLEAEEAGLAPQFPAAHANDLPAYGQMDTNIAFEMGTPTTGQFAPAQDAAWNDAARADTPRTEPGMSEPAANTHGVQSPHIPHAPQEPKQPQTSVAPGRVAEAPAPIAQSKRIVREAQPSLNIDGHFELPPVTLLAEPKQIVHDDTLSTEALEANARMLENVLADFGVKGEIINVRPGPVVTLYELEPAPGIKSSRVIGLSDDIARSMSAISARVAVVPGRNAIGIELPNVRRETVYLRELMASQDFEKTKASLPLGLGKTIGGEPVVTDLAKTPHLLVAGTTGSGKSVSINTMILSLLYRLSPDQCRMIMIDPKMLELSVYDGIPHLLTPVVTDPKKAVVALKWTVREMEERYKNMSKLGVRNITGYNNRVAEAERKGEPLSRTIQTGYDRETGEAVYETEDLNMKHMPFIVVIIDEMADLMMVAGKDIEGAVQRL